jgi:uncharacterized protein (DUF2237 family)
METCRMTPKTATPVTTKGRTSWLACASRWKRATRTSLAARMASTAAAESGNGTTLSPR